MGEIPEWALKYRRKGVEIRDFGGRYYAYNVRSVYDREKKRSRGERPYSVMKRTFRGRRTFVTTVPRVRVKAMFMCLGHNLFNLLSLTNRRKIALSL